MPLIVMVGIPSSGKTTRARQIQSYFKQELKKDVVLINEQSIGYDKNQYYACKITDLLQKVNQLASTSQKILRAALKSQTQKYLTPQRIVILDSLNYIKGQRYQLFCLVRNIKTTQCTVFCDTSPEKARQFNEESHKIYESQQNKDTITMKPMEPQLFEDYHGRMQRPNTSNRWDSPTFIILPQFKKPPFGDIKNALYAGKKPKQPVPSRAQVQVDSNFLFELEQKSNEIISFILCSQNQWSVGQSIGITDCGGEKLKFKMILTAPQLKRMKIEFIKLCKLKVPKGTDLIKQLFVEYINEATERIM